MDTVLASSIKKPQEILILKAGIKIEQKKNFNQIILCACVKEIPSLSCNLPCSSKIYLKVFS